MASHGDKGPISVAYPNYIYQQCENVFRGFQEVGIQTSRDINDGDATGAAIVPSSLDARNQTRSDARTAYYDPAISRSNLHVLIGYSVTRLILGAPNKLEGGRRRVVGVEVGQPLSAPISKPVFVPARRTDEN